MKRLIEEGILQLLLKVMEVVLNVYLFLMQLLIVLNISFLLLVTFPDMVLLF